LLETGIQAGNKASMMSLAHVLALAEKPRSLIVVRSKSQDTQIARASLVMSAANNIETSLSYLVKVIPPDRDDEPEDIFAAAPGFLFTDDLTNSHGAPEAIIQYQNKRFGNIELQTADPEGEQERTLFSHYLWNAGLKLGELISHADQQEDMRWNVEGERVMELGAGVGLGGIVAALAGAQEVCATDGYHMLGNAMLTAAYRSSFPITQQKS
jgi:hypothetical protein